MSYCNGPIVTSAYLYGQPMSTSSNNFFQADGDTIRLCSSRVPSSSSATGYPGEFCFGTASGTTYLYYCVSANSWQRCAFSTF
jgi:hypothetical protein